MTEETPVGSKRWGDGGGEPTATEREGKGGHPVHIEVLGVEGEVAGDLGRDGGGRDV